jgi:hypothetical protein
MGWFRRDPVPETNPDPPVISEHAQEILTQAKETRTLIERLLTENHFAGKMKKTLRKPGKKKA